MSNMSMSNMVGQRTSPMQPPLRDGLPPGNSAASDVAGQGQGVGAVRDRASARDQLNMQILKSSAEVSIQAGDQSQALLFRAAIDHINEVLAPELGADAIQGKASEDNSAEATAERILSLSTGFFDAYAAQHAGDDPKKVAEDFVGLIRGGFEKGFKEATDILQGLKVFSGGIESGVMKTYDLVSKGYDDFLASKLAAVDSPKAAITASAA